MPGLCPHDGLHAAETFQQPMRALRPNPEKPLQDVKLAGALPARPPAAPAPVLPTRTCIPAARRTAWCAPSLPASACATAGRRRRGPPSPARPEWVPAGADETQLLALQRRAHEEAEPYPGGTGSHAEYAMRVAASANPSRLCSSNAVTRRVSGAGGSPSSPGSRLSSNRSNTISACSSLALNQRPGSS